MRGLSCIFWANLTPFSLQWDVQVQVQTVRERLASAGVPTWMDVDGGMRMDIFDSMAEGVTNAACVVCFMTQKYQDSENCALELKFAKQSGIPIVPALMEAPDERGRPWKASGWLGILTAGALYTPLYDRGTFAESVQNLLRQIKVAVHVDQGAEDAGAAFSVGDLREELERLRADEAPDATRGVGADGARALPAEIPVLPAGLRVSAEMRQLRRMLLTPASAKVRLGLHGMGGGGKTIASAWLVREPEVRAQFGTVLWVALGQEPNVRSLQVWAFCLQECLMQRHSKRPPISIYTPRTCRTRCCGS